MVLERILKDKREQVTGRMQSRPLDSFARDLQPASRNLIQALSHQSTGFVLECKKASPSKGVLRAEFDPVGIAREYAPFADAVSVLTDELYFQGRLDYLGAVRQAVDLPLLCKDFVVDPYQVFEARKFGADAILLMMSVLDDDMARKCLAAVEQLGMSALVEVHDEVELGRAVALGAKLIGINNRNLKTLQVDLGVTERLAPAVPGDVVCIAESGVRNNGDVLRLRHLVDGFLVGGSLMSAARIDYAVRELIFGRVKVCGLTGPDQAQLAWRLGASWGGLIFASQSPRRVTMEQAGAIRSAAPLHWVGVFVDAPMEHIARIARELALDAIQLHGAEDRAFVQALRSRLPSGCAIFKAHRVRSGLPALAEFGADKLLLDTYHASLSGGTGERFDWRLVGSYPEPQELILAGGIGPGNVMEAQRLGAWALDVNSGVESAPGKKDGVLIAALFRALRNGEGSLTE